MWSRRTMTLSLLALAGCQRASGLKGDGDLSAANRRQAALAFDFLALRPSGRFAQVWPADLAWSRLLTDYLNDTGSLRLALADPALGPAARKLETRLRQVLRDDGGKTTIQVFGPGAPDLAPASSLDAVLMADALPALMLAGCAEMAFAAAARALRAGAVLGIVQARAKPHAVQDPLARDGYVQQAYVKRQAADAGLTFDRASEALANPLDSRADGGRTSSADRMLLRFRKIG